MAPAFSSPRQAALFALFLLASLLSPILLGKSELPSRERVYGGISWNSGDYPFIHQQIFQEKGDIDIVFMGSSHMYDDIDTPYVQKELSKKLGRPATVLSLCWRWPGLDPLYIIAQDLLEHRKVHMLVFYDDQGTNDPHVHAWQIVRYADNGKDLSGLPLSSRIAYYYGAIVGMPRNLFSLIHPDKPFYLGPKMIQFLRWNGAAPDLQKLPSDNLGAESDRENYFDGASTFTPYTPPPTANPPDALVYSDITANRFEFFGPPAPPLQRYFASKLIALAAAHGTKLICLSLPQVDTMRSAKVPEPRLWPDALRDHADLIGIPPEKLFAGMDDDSVHRLFDDGEHLNDNGQRYFTRLITPSLIHLYESTAH
jgi:hypothetical protein